jgi:serine/threonine protein kinase
LIDLYQLAVKTTNELGLGNAKETLGANRSQTRYRKIRHLGTGGTKRVYEVHDLILKRKVALALPHRGKESIHSLTREARLNAQLDHPNIIKVFDLGSTSKGLPFYTMEMKPGEDLKSWIMDHSDQGGGLEEKLEIAMHLLNAMEYAHQRGIIHLDIKPSNVQIGHHGEVLLCDWGLGQSAESPPVHVDVEGVEVVDHNMFNDITRMGRAKGTTGYMAPECLSLEAQLGPHCDVYSYGVVLLDLLTGIDAQGESPEDRLAQSTLNRSLRAIVQRCTEKEPSSRYDSAAEIKIDLLLTIKGSTPSAETTHVFQEAWRWVKRHQALVLKSVGTFVALSALAWMFFLFYSRLTLERDRVEKENLELEKHSNELKLYAPSEKHVDYVVAKVIARGPLSEDINQILLGHKVSAKDNSAKSIGQCALIHFLRQEFDASLGYAKRLAGDDRIVFSRAASIEVEVFMPTLELLMSKASTLEHDQIRTIVMDRLVGSGLHFLAKLWICADWWIHEDRHFYEKHPDLMGTLCVKGFDWISYNAKKDQLTLSYDRKTINDRLQPFPLILPMKRLILHSGADMSVLQFNRFTLTDLDFSGAELHQQNNFKTTTRLKVNDVIVARP